MASTVATPQGRHSTVSSVHWSLAVNIVLGLWLASTALTLEPHPSSLLISDLAASGIIVAGSVLAWCFPGRGFSWIVAGVGVWLMCAPLVFWAPTASAYGTDTLIGSLVLTFSALIPSLVTSRDRTSAAVPPGWSYNPSAWPQRVGIIAFAFAQFFIARYMAAFQLGHTSEIWDPIFGDGTRQVLNSEVSKSFPVSDAGLGGVTYLVEALTGFLGGTRRWRTMPWAVALFGIMIVPVGVVSVVLVMLQPIAVGEWCFWCLLTAGMTVVMIGPAIDELVATLLFLFQARHEGQSLWHVFWNGGMVSTRTEDIEPREEQSLLHQLAGGLELLSIPWNLAIAAVVGLWMMIAPATLGNVGISANNDQMVGALVATFAVIGFSEAGRAARFALIPLGLWLVAAQYLLTGATVASYWNSLAMGTIVIALAFRRGRITEQYGAWNRRIL